MKKIILGVVAIGSLIALSGCAEPGGKKVYTAGQQAYECGAYDVIFTPGSKTVHGVKETGGRDSTGFLTYQGTSERIAGRITIDSWAMKPNNTYLLSNGTFRTRKGETWSFRKHNGKYYLGFSKYPITSGALGGSWCERTH